jgi:broad specificity phosphatase PhoE
MLTEIKNGKTELWLIRHGVTDWNIAKRYQGSTDVPLNAEGIAQAREAAAQLRGEKFAALYCSPLTRTRQTAHEISQVVGLPILIDERLCEGNQGEWETRTLDEIDRLYPGMREKRRADPVHNSPPGGETMLQVMHRIVPAADDIARAHPGQKVLVVSHGMALAGLISLARNLPLIDSFNLILPNAAAEVITWQAGSIPIPEN